jgi:hypothetical protein
MPPSSAWIAWATDIAKYPERIKKVWEEHQSDVHENIQLLNKSGKKTRDGYQGSKAYICALNFVMQDANFCQTRELRGDSLYKAQMRAYMGDHHRVFCVISLMRII